MEAETCLEYPRPPTLIHKLNYKVNVFCAKMVSEGSLPVEFSFIESCVVVWIVHCDSISRSGLQVSRRHSLPLTEWLPGQTNHKCVCHTIYVMYISFTADLYIHWSFIFFFLNIFNLFLFLNSHSLLSSMLSMFFVYHFMSMPWVSQWQHVHQSLGVSLGCSLRSWVCRFFCNGHSLGIVH